MQLNIFENFFYALILDCTSYVHSHTQSLPPLLFNRLSGGPGFVMDINISISLLHYNLFPSNSKCIHLTSHKTRFINLVQCSLAYNWIQEVPLLLNHTRTLAKTNFPKHTMNCSQIHSVPTLKLMLFSCL
jgi:hypothetical protein